MGCTVEEMLNRISSAELSEWQAEYAIEPWGEDRQAMQLAYAVCRLAAFWATSGDSLRVSDFLLDFAETRKPTPEELAEKIRLAFGVGV